MNSINPVTLKVLIAMTMSWSVLWIDVSTFGQEVAAQISSRQAYVGSPVVLTLQVVSEKKYELPDLFEIENCDVQLLGQPSIVSRVTIYNGRRSENRIVTQQYRITPHRIGSFQVPALSLTVDGQPKKTQPIEFIATKSDVGELMFVEIQGNQDKVYVGEPLDLSLKIWIKPYQDSKLGIKLNESHCWQLISNLTDWGSFTDQLEDLTNNRRRPSGQSVLRDNKQGSKSEYYLYEIDTTIYPNKPGSIEGGEVQIVVNYPVELGQAPDPFDSFFGNRSSLMKRMMGDDRSGGSPFGRTLTVTKTRPIIANAEIDSAIVEAVPTVGKPADYRGAVGRYRIITEAEPVVVDAGDPITLRIGIVGDGPMDLIQPPPLTELMELNADFKVADRSLAGFVQDDTKVFVTTIRPRRSSVTQIPPIPISFFDPDKSQFETVYSKPIALQVNAAETLSLDSIISDTVTTPDTNHGRPNQKSLAVKTSNRPNLENDYSQNVLNHQTVTSRFHWHYFCIVPSLIWAFTALVSLTARGKLKLPDFRSPEKVSLSQIQSAVSIGEIRRALVTQIGKQTNQALVTDKQAAGVLRTNGFFTQANEFESVISRLDRTGRQTTQASMRELKSLATELSKKISLAIDNEKTFRIRSKRKKNKSIHRKSATLGVLVLLFTVTAMATGYAEQNLTLDQRNEILDRANRLYQQGQQKSTTDQAESKLAFEKSAIQYQVLVDHNISNSALFVNLANAQFQSNQLGRAIANYRRALNVNPSSRQAITNLRYVQQKLDQSHNRKTTSEQTENRTESIGFKKLLTLVERWPIQTFGESVIGTQFAVCSIIFWAMMIIKTSGVKTPFSRLYRWAAIPLIGVLATGAILFSQDPAKVPLAIVVDDQIVVYTGDGEEFDVLKTLTQFEGKELNYVRERGQWIQIAVPTEGVNDPLSGWVHQNTVEVVR